MVSASKQAVAGPPAAGAVTATARPVAGLNARISAYVIDSLVLVGFILVFFVAGGAVLLFSSDLGADDPPDSAYYAFVATFLGGTLLAWSVFNVTLLRLRGQTAGMYLVGIRTIGEDASALDLRRTLLRWLGLHPLLFHPFLLPVWGILSLLAVSLTLSQVVLALTLALVLLCLVSPAAGLVAVLLDAERRTLPDRLTHTLVVHLEEP